MGQTLTNQAARSRKTYARLTPLTPTSALQTWRLRSVLNLGETVLAHRGHMPLGDLVIVFMLNSANEQCSVTTQHGQSVKCKMGVVVQQMVPAQSAGVLFTRHPVTGDPRQILITANYGLGESVVSAHVEPDTILLNRGTGNKITIKEIVCGKKAHKTTMTGLVKLLVLRHYNTPTKSVAQNMFQPAQASVVLICDVIDLGGVIRERAAELSSFPTFGDHDKIQLIMERVWKVRSVTISSFTRVCNQIATNVNAADSCVVLEEEAKFQTLKGQFEELKSLDRQTWLHLWRGGETGSSHIVITRRVSTRTKWVVVNLQNCAERQLALVDDAENTEKQLCHFIEVGPPKRNFELPHLPTGVFVPHLPTGVSVPHLPSGKSIPTYLLACLYPTYLLACLNPTYLRVCLYPTYLKT
uniref:Pyruvate phosphate dikinase AMP/ATP-binding domain-containing protein n=1 Tax=Timema tahoe TaxID=61484 RepID=A0A7R9IN86_9NEOP|nr:unnamed protein product [Timema tahoe]